MKYLFLYIVRENIRQGNKEIYVDQVFLVLELEMSVFRIVNPTNWSGPFLIRRTGLWNEPNIE